MSDTTLTHWNFFLALEDDLVQLSRFVEFTEDNYKCYSLEMARILMSASAEAEVVVKRLCHDIDPKRKPRCITDYRCIILSRYHSFSSSTVLLPRYGLKLKPWSRWTNTESPKWWAAHNKVKHHRHTKFSQANLKNSLNAVGALFVAILALYSTSTRQRKLTPNPRIFQAKP